MGIIDCSGFQYLISFLSKRFELYADPQQPLSAPFPGWSFGGTSAIFSCSRQAPPDANEQHSQSFFHWDLQGAFARILKLAQIPSIFHQPIGALRYSDL